MDSITHVALGAITGEALAGKWLGKRALFLGAIAQSLPDIDFVAAFFLSPTDNLLAHRGFTHSFLFGVLATAACAAGSQRVLRARNVPPGRWVLFWGVGIFIHLLLDACNAYGIGWFEPFHDKRFSIHLLFVADILFSLPLGVGLIALMTLSSKNPTRRLWIIASLTATALYFAYAVYNKSVVNEATRDALADQGIEAKRFFTTPTPANTWLWFVVVEDDSGFHITHRSTFDNRAMDFTYFPQQRQLLKGLGETDDVDNLLEFSQGYYTIAQRGDTLLFNDLRFGQIAGWADPKAGFVFHYYLNYPEANLLVIQRGRFSNWNRRTFTKMLERIGGG